jgi:hypothetical protein
MPYLPSSLFLTLHSSFGSVLVVIATFLLCVVWGQTPHDQALALLAQMTLTEKLAMVHGYLHFSLLLFICILISNNS